MPDLPVTTNSPAGALTPAILSEPVEVSKPRGETAQFHCKVKHLGKRTIFYDRKYIYGQKYILWPTNEKYCIWTKLFFGLVLKIFFDIKSF